MAFVFIIAAVILAGTVFGLDYGHILSPLKQELAIIEYSISIIIIVIEFECTYYYDSCFQVSRS